MNITIDTPYVTVKEFARRTGQPERTVREHIRDGRILAIEKTGKKAVFVNMVAMIWQAAEQASRVTATSANNSVAR